MSGIGFVTANGCKNRIHRFVEIRGETKFVVLNALCKDLVPQLEKAAETFNSGNVSLKALKGYGGPALSYVALLEYVKGNNDVAKELATEASKLDQSSLLANLLMQYEPSQGSSGNDMLWCPDSILDSMMRRIDMVHLLDKYATNLKDAALVVTGCSRATHMNLWELFHYGIKALLLLDSRNDVLQEAVSKIISHTNARLPVPVFVASQSLHFVDSLIARKPDKKTAVIAAFTLGRLSHDECVASLKFAREKNMTIFLLDFDLYAAAAESRVNGFAPTSAQFVANVMDAFEQGLQGDEADGVPRLHGAQGAQIVQWLVNILKSTDSSEEATGLRDWDMMLDEAGYTTRRSILDESSLKVSESEPLWWAAIRFDLCYA